MEHALVHGSGPKQNGWSLTYHAFDYNLDYFEVGALDDDKWKMQDAPERYLERALAARGGLWGNHGYQAAYAMVYGRRGRDRAGWVGKVRAALCDASPV